jgi:hypothetical protein
MGVRNGSLLQAVQEIIDTHGFFFQASDNLCRGKRIIILFQKMNNYFLFFYKILPSKFGKLGRLE